MTCRILLVLLLSAPLTPAQVTAITAGRLIDPATGRAEANQAIVVEAGRLKSIGTTAPPGAEVIDPSQLPVLPCLVHAHTHLAMTYQKDPENDGYYLTSVL